jgi:hypothetical protein
LPLPFYWIFGRRWHAAYLVCPVAMMVLFGAVWQIGKRLRGDRAGLRAVYIAGTLPLLFGLSRLYLVEYPLAGVVAAAFWLALVTAESVSLGPAVALGVVCGLGLLLKVTFPIFVLPFLAYVLRRRRPRARLLLAILLPCAAVAMPWYIDNWRATFSRALVSGFGSLAQIYGTGPVFSVSTIQTYLGIVARRALSPWYILIVAATAIVLVARRRFEAFRQAAPLGFWLLPFLIFVFGENKDVRLIAPILPAFALVAACLIDAATEGRRWLAVAALLFPLVSFCAVSFGWPYHASDLGYAARYDGSTWGQDEILSAIAANSVYRFEERKLILVATDRGRFNADNFNLAIVQRQLPFRVETTAYATSLDEVVQMAAGSAYVVYKEGGEPESKFFNTHAAELLARLKKSPEWLEMPFSFSVPDGGTAHILRHH